ncbi:MAG: hypothetical protein QW303_08870 [Nitrososphaerota archaeon]
MTNITKKTTWNEICIGEDYCKKIGDLYIPVYDANMLEKLYMNNYIMVGPGIFLEPSLILKTQPFIDVLTRIPFNFLCLYFFMNNYYTIFDEMEALIEKEERSYFMTQNGNIILNEQYLTIANKLSIAKLRIELVKYHFQQMQWNNESLYNWFFKDILLYRDLPVQNIDTYDNQEIDDHESYDLHETFYEFTKGWIEDYNHKTKCETKIDCTFCYEEDIPFIMFKKLLSENVFYQTSSNKSINQILDEYYDKHIVCFKCANFYFSSKKDPMKSECQFISLLPLVRLDNDKLKKAF